MKRRLLQVKMHLLASAFRPILRLVREWTAT